MADDKEKVIKQLNNELDQLDTKLKSLTASLKDNMITQLSNASTEVKNLVTSFEKGDDLTKVISKTASEIAKNYEKNNALSFKRNRLEFELSQAIQTNNVREERKIRNKLLQNKLTIDQLDTTTQLLTKIQALAEEEVRITAEKKKQANIAITSRKIFDEFVKPYKELASVEGILKLIINSALTFNKISTDIGKNLGYGGDGADRVAGNFVKIARDSNNVNITTQNLAEAFNQLSEATGLVSEYSADALKTQVMLTKQFGLTGEEAAGVYRLSVLNGKSSAEINKSMVSAFVAARNQLGVGIPFKATMAEAAKISGQLAANLKNNPQLLVQAVAQAKALGTTLEQTKSQGEALLNFESSIENELKAELLTGKAINLERARAAALMGDQVTVAKELANQGMTLEKFQNMNVLAQQSFAAAIGLSADALANQLRQQKLAIESGKSLAQITEEEALEAQKRQSIQDKFNASILKLQDFFGNLLSGPVGGFLTVLTQSLDVITSIVAVMGTMWGLSKAIAAFNALTLGLQIGQRTAGLSYNGILLARQALLQGELTKSIGIAAATAFKNPILAIAGLAAAYGAISLIRSASQSVEDGIAPSSKGPFTITDKFGATAITKTGDGLAVSPNISKGADNSGMIAAINSLHQTLTQKNFNPVVRTSIGGSEIAITSVQNSFNMA
jgi:hypothetical protein